MPTFVAVDLGAESGRVLKGTLTEDKLTLDEVHRFPNEYVSQPAGLFWNITGLYAEILRGLRKAGPADGIGIDAWGVDYALIDANGELIGPPHYYRDPRTHGIIDKLLEAVPKSEIFRQTGIQFMHINTLCQIYAAKLAHSPALTAADKLLFIPDLLNYWLTGVAKAERTIASTSQFYNPAEENWATKLFQSLGLPHAILPELVSPGSLLGPVRPELELGGTPVYAVAGHDTASAVAAVPAQQGSWCYISSGTWSLMGVELERPLIDDRVLTHNFTNEAGFGGTTRLLKNIAGLWLLQECRRAWALAGEEHSYEELVTLAGESTPYEGYIDPDAFLVPGHMPDQIGAWCREHRQPVPKDAGAMARAILQSLANRYAQVFATLEELTGSRIDVVHIVGGGSRNRLLNQLTANACGRPVLAGPVEATAIGNLLVQAIGAGALPDLTTGRYVVANSFAVERFVPL